MMKNILDVAKSTFTKGIDNKITLISKDKIVLNDELKSLFAMDEAVVTRIAADMKKNGFSIAHPLHVFKYEGEIVLIDGHTRFTAAQRSGIKKVYVQFHDFKSIEEAKLYSMQEQFNRRNIQDSELYEQFIALLKQSNNKLSECEVGNVLHKSRRTVSKIFKIKKSATEEQINDLKNNKISINKLYNDITEKERLEKELLNKDEEKKGNVENSESTASKKKTRKTVSENEKVDKALDNKEGSCDKESSTTSKANTTVKKAKKSSSISTSKKASTKKSTSKVAKKEETKSFETNLEDKVETDVLKTDIKVSAIKPNPEKDLFSIRDIFILGLRYGATYLPKGKKLEELIEDENVSSITDQESLENIFKILNTSYSESPIAK